MGKKPTNSDVQFWRDPDLPGVELRHSSYAKEAFRKHAHPEYSIGYIETGSTTFTLEDRPWAAGAGHMVFIEPGAVHACNPDLDTVMTYSMFYVDAPWLISVAEEAFEKRVEMVDFPEPVVDDPALLEQWRALNRAIVDGGDRLEKESLLVQGLADLIARHGQLGETREPPKDADAVRRVKAHLAENRAEKISLDALSAVAHMSRYHLLRVFQTATGLPPHAYQNQLRVDFGKQLLARGMSISQAALEAGFSDQPHFSRVFKQYTGATPKQYQSAQFVDTP